MKKLRDDIVSSNLCWWYYYSNYFLGLQVKQYNDVIFISQSKYARNLLKKFGLETSMHIKTLMGTNENLSQDENNVSIDPTLYRSMI